MQKSYNKNRNILYATDSSVLKNLVEKNSMFL